MRVELNFPVSKERYWSRDYSYWRTHISKAAQQSNAK